MWGGPGGEALALAAAMEVRRDGAGGALAGGDDEATAGEPRVDLLCFHFSVIRWRPHSSFIRLWAEEMVDADRVGTGTKRKLNWM
jgi:hypothetical protein